VLALYAMMVTAAFAVEPPAEEWHHGFGTDGGDHVHYGMQTSDGGYIMIGQASERRRGSNMLVVKTNGAGEFEWQHVIGAGGGLDFGNIVVETEGGFIAAGGLKEDGDQDRCLVKFSNDGAILWQKTYPHEGNDSIRGIDITRDGGIIATGHVGSEERGYQFIADDCEGYLLKTDADGTLLWEKTLPSITQGIRVYENRDGFAIGGTVYVEGETNHQDGYLLQADGEGNELWFHTYGTNTTDQFFDMDEVADGGYIFGGHSLVLGSVSDNTDVFDFWLVKTDSKGTMEWSKKFGEPRGYDPTHIRDESYGVKAMPDGGFVMVGGSGDEDSYSGRGHPAGRSDIWKCYVVRTDGDGEVLWEGLYGDPESNNAGEYINLTSDGGFVTFNDSDSAGSMGGSNFGMMKIAPDTVGR
jgi:hypothetical protein